MMILCSSVSLLALQDIYAKFILCFSVSVLSLQDIYSKFILCFSVSPLSLQDIYAKFKEYHEDEVTVISMQASSLLAAEYKAQSEYNIVFPRVSTCMI